VIGQDFQSLYQSWNSIQASILTQIIQTISTIILNAHNNSIQPITRILSFLLGDCKELCQTILTNALRENDADSCFDKVVFLDWIVKGVNGNIENHESGAGFQFLSFLYNAEMQAKYTHFFLMEHDCYPIKPNWISKLHGLTMQHNFWIQGGIYNGDGRYDNVTAILNHINGNVIYKIGDSEFIDLVRQDPSLNSNGTLYSYDMIFYGMWNGKFDNSAGNRYRVRYMRSDFIVNNYTLAIDLSDFAKNYPATYFVHVSGYYASREIVYIPPLPEYFLEYFNK
jgi:hypothetical protein